MTRSFRRGDAASSRLRSGAAASTCSKIVDDEKHLPILDERGQRLEGGLTLALDRSHRLGEGVHHQLGVVHGRQRREACAALKAVGKPLAELERQPRLADPDGAGEREQPDPAAGQERLRRRQVVLAAEQRRGRDGQRARIARWVASPAAVDPARDGTFTRRCRGVERRVLGEYRDLEAL